MNYSALIQNRKSVREFTDTQVAFSQLEALKQYYLKKVRRLIPEIKTELHFYGTDARDALEGSAGYNSFLIGSPQYLVLLGQKHPQLHIHSGYLMEDLVLKLQDMGLDSCWVTFADGEAVKEALAISSEWEVGAILAFGYGKKTTKRLRLNIRSMSNVDLVAKHRYMDPKRSVQDMAFLKEWGNSYGLEQYIGFFDDMLWEALYAASLSPSYLNRQAYGFVLGEGTVTLVARPDVYNTKIDEDLSLGIVLHHFSSVAEAITGKLHWRFGLDAELLPLPEGHRVIASCSF